MISPKDCTIGFIGLGVMGKSMATHIMNAGYPVVVYTRSKEKAESILSLGAEWADSPMKVASKANIIISMVGYPADVREIYLGEKGIIRSGKPHTYLIDMTTSTPTLAKEIYEEANKKDMYALDAPVSGGDKGAREAKLSIMVGGDQDVFNKMKLIFDLMGSNVVYQGKAGSGQHTKMCNQITIASNMIGVCEAIIYAEKSGLDPETVLKSISTGAAGSWSLSNLAPRMIEGDFEPGFYIKHFLKDMRIALDEARKMEIVMPGLSLAEQLYTDLANLGEENRGTQALYTYMSEKC
jgi:3-hydroxyisobutyrate dehydrogenase